MLLPLIASVGLSSCIVPVADDVHYPSTAGGHMVYTTLPNTFAGSAYYYNGRYYSGGAYQTGRYRDHGRSYSSRYYHNGQYIYGGKYQQHQARGGHQDQDRSSRRNADDPQRSTTRYSGMVPSNNGRF